MSSINAAALRLKALDREVRIEERKLPWWRRWFRWFFTGKAYIANNLGEAKGYLVSIGLFWTVPAKVWASGAWDHATTLAQGAAVFFKISSEVG